MNFVPFTASPKPSTRSRAASAGGLIEMIMQPLMFGVLLLFPHRAGLLMGGAEVRLARPFRTHGRQRDELLQILAPAARTLRRRRRRQQQVFKTIPAAPALILVDRHERSLSETGGGYQGLLRTAEYRWSITKANLPRRLRWLQYGSNNHITQDCGSGFPSGMACLRNEDACL